MNIFRRISIGVRHLNNSTLRRFQSSIGNSPLKNMTPTKGIAVVTGLSGVIIFLFEHFRLLRMEKVLDELKVESNATKKERIAQTARTDQLCMSWLSPKTTLQSKLLKPESILMTEPINFTLSWKNLEKRPRRDSKRWPTKWKPL